MKRQTVFFLCLLSLILSFTYGCSAPPEPVGKIPEKEDSAFEKSFELPEETPAESSELPESSASEPELYTPNSENEAILQEVNPEEEMPEKVENISGVFEGLEDNHTAIFSFDGAESAFYFEEPAVQKVLCEAVIGSSYTFSYELLPSVGLNAIYEITEN